MEKSGAALLSVRAEPKEGHVQFDIIIKIIAPNAIWILLVCKVQLYILVLVIHIISVSISRRRAIPITNRVL